MTKKIKTSITYYDIQYGYISKLPKNQRCKYIHRLIQVNQFLQNRFEQLKDHACLFEIAAKDILIPKTKSYTIKCDNVELTFNVYQNRAKNDCFHLIYTKLNSSIDLNKMLERHNINIQMYSLNKHDQFAACFHVKYIQHVERIKLVNAKLITHYDAAINIKDGIYSIYQFGNDIIFNKLD